MVLWVIATIPDFHTGGPGSIPPWWILHFSPTFWKKANFVGLLQPFEKVRNKGIISLSKYTHIKAFYEENASTFTYYGPKLIVGSSLRFPSLFWSLKFIKTYFSYFNHQIKSKPSLDCNMRLIKFSLVCPDTALCEALSKNGPYVSLTCFAAPLKAKSWM